MQLSPLVQSLIDALRCLPGVGAKSAQRMAFELLERKREQASELGEALLSAMQNVQHCSKCRILTEEAECAICRNEKRLVCAQLCIVESPSDVLAIEQTGQFGGRYFVLMGHLSPIDGIGPEELGLDNLMSLLKTGDFNEVILATNPTMEGEATAHYIASICDKLQITVTRIAHGVPVGGELGYVDGSTLAHAFSGRKSYQS